MTQLKKLIRLNLGDLALCCGVLGGTFLLTQLIVGAVTASLKPDTGVLLSGLILPITAGIMVLVVSITHTMLTFGMALKFGQTRRRALGQVLGLVGLLSACTMALAGLLTAAERFLAPAFWMHLAGKQMVMVGEPVPIPEGGPEGTAELAREFILVVEEIALPWWGYPLVAVGCIAAGLVIGAVFQRFGGKGMWVLWGVWMFCFLAPQFLPWKEFTILDWLFPLVGVLALAAVVWAVWSLLRATVKS